MSLLPVDEALARLLADVSALPGETVPVAEAAGRVLAGPLVARRTQPPFPASAMDGYAVRAADVASVPVRLSVIGMAAAGHMFHGGVAAGQAVRIFTGAPVPDGADTIVLQEDARQAAAGAVEILEGNPPGRHIRPAGLDFSQGDVLLEAGRLLDPAALSLAAAANHPVLDVVRRPLVALIATGDELLAPGGSPGPDQIIASNAYGVAAVARAAGAAILDLGIAADSEAAIAALVRRAADAGADVLVTLGGASVGEHDLVQKVLAGLGMTLDFWKIAMRPGKPLMFGRMGAMRCLGLPGNPVASLVCSHLFLGPLVARLQGRKATAITRAAKLGAAMPANDLRQDYVRARIVETEGGIVATPFAIQDSSMLRVLADSGGLIVRAPFAPPAAAGDPCAVLLMR